MTCQWPFIRSRSSPALSRQQLARLEKSERVIIDRGYSIDELTNLAEMGYVPLHMLVNLNDAPSAPTVAASFLTSALMAQAILGDPQAGVYDVLSKAGLFAPKLGQVGLKLPFRLGCWTPRDYEIRMLVSRKVHFSLKPTVAPRRAQMSPSWP